jgi:hypothetical protein
MTTFPRIQPSHIAGALVGLALFSGSSSTACGQGGLIGSRGGLTAPTAPTVPTQPVLPPTLNLPPVATNSLLNGLNASGTALRPGMGWLVSDLTHQGIHGQQLADIIHQLKPYKQQGTLTFPQNTPATGTTSQAPGFAQPAQLLPRHGKGGLGHGFGKSWKGK